MVNQPDSLQTRLQQSGAYSLPHPPAAAKFASQGDAHMRTNTQIKFLYYPPAYVSLCHKDFKKHLKKISIKKLSEYIFRQLKQQQRKLRSETSISLEITLNVFKCFIVSLVPLKFLYNLATAPFSFTLVGSLCL